MNIFPTVGVVVVVYLFNMIINSPIDDATFKCQYHRTKEGPNYFIVYYKESAVIRSDPKDAWRMLGVAKFTKNGKLLKDWCLEMDNQYNTDTKEARPDTSFASEAEAEVEPNDNTKMIT